MNLLWMSQGRHKRSTFAMLVIISTAIVTLAYVPWKDSVANVLKPPAAQQQVHDMPPVSMPPLGRTLNEMFRRR